MKTLLLILILTIVCLTQTPLDDYIRIPEPVYHYSLNKTETLSGAIAYHLNLNSLTWRNLSEVNRNVWQHIVSIVTPQRVTKKTALILINGGSNTAGVPSIPKELASAAVLLESVVVLLFQVPNQPLMFPGENTTRKEDRLLAYSWDKFLKNPNDVHWIGQLPMVKSTIKAMDATQDFLKKQNVIIDDFVVTGGSKRGWTTWLVGAVDKRVRAMVPIVIPILGGVPVFKHIYNSYCFWPPALNPYLEMKIMDRIDTPEFKKLSTIIDPLEFADRFKMPKYIISATGDEFFPSDTSQFFYPKLKGEFHLRYIPNANHAFSNQIPEVIFALISYFNMIVNNIPRPEFTWTYNNGTLEVKTFGKKPFNVLMWSATNPKNRDFRVVEIGRVWKRTILDEQGDGVWRVTVNPPPQGWTAFLIELSYRTPLPFSAVFSTPTYIVPDRYPSCQ